MKDVYGVQVYLIRKGRFELGPSLTCRDADAARAEAERRATNPRIAGVSAFWRRVHSEEFDDGEPPVTIAVWGRVPAGVRDALPF